MQKRTAITTAAAIAMTAAAGGSALAVSLGVFSQPERGVVGTLTAEQVPTSTTSTTAEPEVTIETIYVDAQGNPIDPATIASTPAPAPASASAATAAAPRPGPAGSIADEDDHEYDDDLDDDHEYDDEHDDEYEGREDDD